MVHFVFMMLEEIVSYVGFMKGYFLVLFFIVFLKENYLFWSVSSHSNIYENCCRYEFLGLTLLDWGSLCYGVFKLLLLFII